jgi:hypothetical protein
MVHQLTAVEGKRIFLTMYRMTSTVVFDSWFVNIALIKGFEYNFDLMT